MRLREIQNVNFFINWLNSTYNLDFKIDHSYKEEDSPIDVVAKSKEKILNFQNIAYRQGAKHSVGTSNIPNFNPVFILGTSLTPDEKRHGIIKCIESKKNKYPIEVVKDLILLVEITIPSLTPKEIKTLLKTEKGKDFGFAAVYFVKLPVTLASVDNKYDQTGFIYSFKDLDLMKLKTLN